VEGSKKRKNIVTVKENKSKGAKVERDPNPSPREDFGALQGEEEESEDPSATGRGELEINSCIRQGMGK